MATETEFYNEVRKACEAAGIDETGRSFVEMTCLENAYDAPKGEIWDRAIETLKFYVGCNDLLAVSRNER